MDDYLDKIKEVEEEMEKNARDQDLRRKEELEKLEEHFAEEKKENQLKADQIIESAKAEAQIEANKQIEQMEGENKKKIESINKRFTENQDNAITIILEEIGK